MSAASGFGRALYAAALCLAAVTIALSAGPARATSGTDPLVERVLTGSAVDEVGITATFTGQEIFVYGAIARNRFLDSLDGVPDVIIVARGPSSALMVRRKNRVGGVWVNTEGIRIAAAPSFYAVASTRSLAESLRPDEDAAYRISLDRAVVIAGLPTSAADPESFRQATLRLRGGQGLYLEKPGAVQLSAGTLFQTRFRLPANIIEGEYTVSVYLLRDGLIQDEATLALPVRKEGIERLLFQASQDRPFLYGLGTLLTALLAGWGANALFRRLRG